MGLFELTKIGLPVAVVGIGLIVLLAPAVLPERRPAERQFTEGAREFVSRGLPLQRLRQIGSAAHRAGARDAGGSGIVLGLALRRMNDPLDLGALLPEVLEIVGQAGRAIEQVRLSDHEVSEKPEGKGPVTRADREADRLLRRRLLGLVPAGWLSEETADDGARLSQRLVWVVDPLDGTKEFVRGIPEYAAAVALVEGGRPVLGVVHHPPSGTSVWALRGGGCSCAVRSGQAQAVRVLDGDVVLASRSEAERGEFAPFEGEWVIKSVGSIQFKLAQVAQGRGAVTWSRGPKREWDVCAGALLVQEAGGVTSDRRGHPLRFNRRFYKTRRMLAGAPRSYRRALVQLARVGESDRMRELAE